MTSDHTGDGLEKTSPRNYQTELFEIARDQNSIIFLPTGSGKTYIASLLIRHMSVDLKRETNRKWTFFFVNTVELVSQQSKYLERMCPLKVVGLSSESGVDTWEKSQWDFMKETYEVFVMTSQVFLDAVIRAFVSLGEANLLIFDECHSAVKGHPMNKIMDRYGTVPESNRPRILGLSATLLNANSKGIQFYKILQELEQNLRSKIITSIHSQETAMYSTKSQESVEHFAPYKSPAFVAENISKLCNYGINTVESTKIKDDDLVQQILAQMRIQNRASWNPQDILLNAPGIGRSKLLKNALKDIKAHLDLFGMYVAYDCCRCYSVQMYRFLHEMRDDVAYMTLIMFVMNLIQIIWKILQNEITKYGPLFAISTIVKTSSRKLEAVFKKVKSMNAGDKCIVFVERKVTARVLYRLIKMFLKAQPETDRLTVDFVIGSDCNPLRNTKESFYDKRIRKNILRRFKDGNLNIIIATNILEEGIDVQSCNLVIMFDEVKTFRSYVQSKGRARAETSKFIVLNDIAPATIETRLNGFRKIENDLKQIVKDKNISSELLTDESTTDVYTTRLNANIREDESVPLIHRYCATLPHDKFTQLKPFLWRECKSQDGVVCKLSLPVNSAWRDLIRSDACKTQKEAVQNVCFKAVRLLHRERGLDDHFNPIRTLAQLCASSEEWMPNANVEKVEEDDGFFVANMKTASFLKNSRPRCDQDAFLHVIRIEPEYELPDVNRKIFCHGLLANNTTFFGIVTRNELPAVCAFPIYSDLGRTMVRVECNARKIRLSSKELVDVSKFHRFLFMNVLKTVKSCLTYDLSAEDYFVVPLIGEPGDYRIFQKLIRKNVNTDVRRPSADEIRADTYDLRNYIGNIIAPYYRDTEKPHYYVVTNTNTNLFMDDRMENSNQTFVEYYKEKYDLMASRPTVQLFETRKLSAAVECIIPRPVQSSAKQRRRLNRDLSTYLVGEFCCKIDFPAVFWYKALLLPSILHRVHYLLLAEELRRKIVECSGVGRLIRGEDRDDCLESVAVKTSSASRTKAKVAANGDAASGKTVLIKERASTNAKGTTDERENLPKDIYRCVDELTVEDVCKFTDYVDAPLYATVDSAASGPSAKFTRATGAKTAKTRDFSEVVFVDPPPLMTLKRHPNAVGPNQCQILQAITLKGAGDAFHMERAETLGDSFLKYAVSLTIFLEEPKLNEGLLTTIKCSIVGNKNLYKCALRSNIPEYIKAQKFIVEKCWCPPGFSVPQYAKSNFPISRAALLKTKIPYHEQFSGRISDDTIDGIVTTLKEYATEANASDANDEKIGLFLSEKQKLTTKSIADVVEALIGVYLETCGIDGASAILKYLNVLNATHLENALKKRTKPIEPQVSREDFSRLCASYKTIEDTLRYEFKNKGFMLQALTHPSFKFNLYTDCYQKLEFLGDAVLDFLITSHIYEYCDNLSPGELTDLRSSLVNNTTFGALSVRLGLHKHLLANSAPLDGAIKAFVDYQIEMNYEIHGNELMKLVNEDDTLLAEEVDVPKTLGDLFESLAGAIFLDSGYDLEVVWRIYYNLMKEEIDKFSAKIPLNPVRSLHEKCSKCKFVQPMENKDKMEEGLRQKIALRVYSQNENLLCYGVGVNTVAAKRAAAKLALKKLGFNDFVI